MDRQSYDKRNSACGEDDSSLGILNIERLKVFGDLSSDTTKNLIYKNGSNESKILVSDRLSVERKKALEVLQKSRKDVINKKNSNVDINTTAYNPSKLDHTDYVLFRRPNAINISDLVTDETINLENSSSCPPSASKDSKVSFEPAEITGRSTLYNKDVRNRNKILVREGKHIDGTSETKHISVCDILASSFAPKARNLCENLESVDTTLDSNIRRSHRISSVPLGSVCSSSFTSFNGSKSLPRTADMSLSKNTCTEESFNCGLSTFSFSSAGAGTNINENEDFAPGELMRSKLLSDEISWAQEYAAIPTSTLSEQAKTKVARISGEISNGFDSPSSTNSIIIGDPNFSVGNFFNMRSDKICNIVASRSPDRCRTPVALVDEDDNTVTTTTEVKVSPKMSITPKIDNKTYTRVGSQSFITKTSISEKISVGKGNQERKNLENSADNSYLLSFSAIDRALCNLDIQSDVSGIGVSEQLLQQKRKAKSCTNPYLDVANNNYNGEEIRAGVKSLDAFFNAQASKIISENKENLNPDRMHSSSKVALSDTMSFTESLLNSSDMKQLRRHISKSRSSLSPINIAPNIRVSQVEDGEEADNDDCSGTPITRNKRLRRTKSPSEKIPISLNTAMLEVSFNATTPINSRSSRSLVQSQKETVKEPTSMSSSTLLDEKDQNSSKSCNFENSPNVSNAESSLVIRNNTLVAPQIVSPGGATTSPNFSNSPLSSPCTYNCSQLPSPTPTTLGFQSPNDATTYSDRQILSAGATGKVVSSPVGSESSSTCSYGILQTYRSTMSGTSVRSVSRCSSSSEFSHRDGQNIPLKITNTELSWGSVKLRSESQKSMQIKNIFNKRLVIRIEVYGPGFQIVNSQRSNTLTLQSQECRSININFCPTVRGVAIGKLSFYAPSAASAMGQSFLDVSLYGYGGNASVILQNITMGPVGLPFVTIGKVHELGQRLERTVSFYNKGPLLGFAAISIDSTGLMLPRLSDAFEVYPQKILIPPQKLVEVHIVFRPKREEIRKLIKKKGHVLTLANMRIICGDEANRQRIRLLLAQMSEEERAKLSSGALDMLWSKFPQEREMKDLHEIKENPGVAMDLASFLRIHEILLTINHDNMDDTVETSSLFLPDVDETVLFRTICTANSPTPSTNLETVNEHFEGIDADKRSVISSVHKPWSVSPKCIEISLSKKEHIALSIINGYKSRKFFEAECNLKDILYCTPKDGYIAPDGGRTDIDISLLKNLARPLVNVCVIVYMENEKIIVPVKIVE